MTTRITPSVQVDLLPELSVQEPTVIRVAETPSAMPLAKTPLLDATQERTLLVGTACAAAIAVAVFVVRRRKQELPRAPKESGALGAILKSALFAVGSTVLRIGAERLLAKGIRRASAPRGATTAPEAVP